MDFYSSKNHFHIQEIQLQSQKPKLVQVCPAPSMNKLLSIDKLEENMS